MNSSFLIILVAMFALMYLLMIRPQKAKQRAMRDLLNRLGPGDEVITVGGIYGDVVEVEGDKVVLEIAEDVHIEVARRAIASLVPPQAEDEAEEEAEEAEEADPEPASDADAAAEAEEAQVEEPAR